MIYVLPGMGADSRMYDGPWRRLWDTRFLDWPKGFRGQDIPELAQRVVLDAGIGDGATLVGSSLGGMVACEITRLRRIERLILVGSAKSREEISGILHALHPLIGLAPIGFIRAACGKLPSDLCSMFAGSEPAFIRSMCRAIFEWDGLGEGFDAVHRIHGRHDLVIPPPNDGETLIEGGHLIAVTHPEECVRWINSVCGNLEVI